MKWESSAPSVAKVDGNGKVTAVSEGEATIKVTALDGGYTAECLVKVMSAQQYVKDKISIVQTGFSGQIINGVPMPGSSWSFKVTNNGDVTVYLKEVRGYGSSKGTISINKQIASGRSYSGSFTTNSIDWVFEIAGTECIKRY